MAYIVKEIEPSSLSALSPSRKVCFPSDAAETSSNGVYSDIHRGYLALFQRERGDTRKGSLVHFKEIFGHHQPDYQIVIHQVKPNGEKITYITCETSTESKAQEAFDELHRALSPLLQDGSVVLTEPLVRLAVLPRPRDACQLSMELVELMEKKPDSHPEWSKVMQALLHVACKREDRKKVEILVKKGGDLNKKNNFGLTPLKSASLSVSSEGMKWLNTFSKTIEKSFGLSQSPEKSALNALIGASSTIPLAMAVPEDSQKYADFESSEKIWQSMKEDHALPARKVLKKQETKRNVLAIIQSSRASMFNETALALMMSIEKGYVKSCMYLLLSGANPNYCQESTGNTSLHLAVISSNLLLVKLLLVFDANPNIKNADNQTPLDIAMTKLPVNKGNSQIIIKELQDMMKLHRATEQYFLEHNHQPTPRGTDGIYLLSMDGGGIRSFNTLLMLRAIEKRMLQLVPTSKPVQTYFDYIAGTSSGAISALVMAYTDASIQSGLALIYKIVTDVFDRPLDKRSDRMEQYLQDAVGEDTVMSDLDTDQRIIIMSTLANCDPWKLHLITNYGKPRDEQKGPDERKVWEAGRISSAAPKYFPAFEKQFLDGGLIANNPTADAMVEVFEQGKIEDKDVKIDFVLSLGTGISPEAPVDCVDVFFSGLNIDFLMSIPDIIKSVSSLYNLFLSEITQSNGQQALRAKMWCESIGAAYHRLSPPLSKDINPSTTDMDVIIDMKYEAKKYILQVPDEIDSIAHVLLSK